MSETRRETKTDEEIAKDVSRHPNEREGARARLIHAEDAAKAAKSKPSEEPKHE